MNRDQQSIYEEDVVLSRRNLYVFSDYILIFIMIKLYYAVLQFLGILFSIFLVCTGADIK